MFIASCYIVITFYAISHNVLGLYHTALVDLKRLVLTRKIVYDTLMKYKDGLDINSSSVYRYLEIIKTNLNSSMEDPEGYVSNVINALLLIKYLTVDWNVMVEAVKNSANSKDLLHEIITLKELHHFPSSMDWDGAVSSLTCLQDTYNLDTALLVRGYIKGVKYNTILCASDCFEIGKHCFNIGDYYHAQIWLEEAENQVKKETNSTIDIRHIFEYLLARAVIEGDTTLKYNYALKLFTVDPNFPNNLISTIETIKSQQMPSALEDFFTKASSKTNFNSVRINAHSKKLCRGDIPAPPSTLKCKYVTNTNPFLILAPFKVEEINADPQIDVFHDVIYDSEIQSIKQVAEIHYIEGDTTKDETERSYRVAKTVWLEDYSHKHVHAISLRVADMTNLSMKFAESLHVSNYGIGGEYLYHYDHETRGEVNAFEKLGTGNRYVTVIFYLTNVIEGGATVFPLLNITLWPRKGAAVRWYNLHSSGDGHTKAQHAACPVLQGSKWIANKWLHTLGQELLKPCDMTRPPQHLIN